MIGGQLQTCTGQVSAEGARRRCLQCQATPPSVDFLQTQYQANWPSRGGTTGLATAVVHYGCEDRPRNFTKVAVSDAKKHGNFAACGGPNAPLFGHHEKIAQPSAKGTPAYKDWLSV
ncbi:uncharacterized protein LOC143021931 isoform X1 [Oratosquilla oratoria]|uniref:uncharacterized protein LOC143021931 isoform X1 n=1 Tax=Oratosquilla oratoria TaxID=337810 RepID=UPI003F76A3D6